MAYIRLDRKFFENPYWKQKRTFSLSEAWLDLIQLARFDAEPTDRILPNGRQITIERGEIHASLRFLSDRWGWSVDKTLRYINRHKEKQEIKHRTQQGETLLMLCNYDKYNPLSNTDTYTKTNTDQYTDQTPTSTNNNKDNNVNKEKEGNIWSPEISDFEKFNIWIKENCEYCSNPKNIKQLSEKEFLKLKEKFGSCKIMESLLDLENRKDLRSRYSNLYRTLNNWSKKVKDDDEQN